MESKINGQAQPEAQIDGRKEIKIPYPFEIKKGDEVEITAYNTEGKTGSVSGKFNAQE